MLKVIFITVSQSEFLVLTKNDLAQILQSWQVRNFKDKCEHLDTKVKKVTDTHFTSDLKKNRRLQQEITKHFKNQSNVSIEIKIRFVLATPKS